MSSHKSIVKRMVNCIADFPASDRCDLAYEIKHSIECRVLVIPQRDKLSRYEIKQWVQKERWDLLGEYFGFEPKFCMLGGKRYFNWVSAPTPMMQMLFKKPLPRQTAADFHKKLAAKAEEKKQAERLPGRYTRRMLFERQKGICFYCQAETSWEHWTRDHKHPMSKGGRAGSNLVGACRTCNNAKGSQELHVFLSSDYLKKRRTAGDVIKALKEAVL